VDQKQISKDTAFITNSNPTPSVFSPTVATAARRERRLKRKGEVADEEEKVEGCTPHGGTFSDNTHGAHLLPGGSKSRPTRP
jgi:hypothetical protein